MAAAVLLVSGCTSTEPPAAVVEAEDAMLHLGPTIRPEELLFPDYLLMLDFELDQHGRIFGSTVIGADLKTELDILTVRQRFAELLAEHGWRAAEPETGEHFFLLRAGTGDELIEIRAVQGTGPTRVFILYQPDSGPLL